MAKKRKVPPARGDASPKPPKPVFASPFKELKKLFAERTILKPVEKPAIRPAPVPPPIEADDEAVLRQALEGVRPLNRALRVPVLPEINRAIVSEEAEALAQLSDLVSGQR